MKQTPAALSIRWAARRNRRMTGAEDMNSVTQEYQISDDAVTRPIIRPISQTGVAAVTAVAKTLENRTMAFGLVRVTRKPNSSERLPDRRGDRKSTRLNSRH